ncbi:hypothetical protein [Alteromonas halophila]|uniref:Uncharacterized protein n=1 Tax=Alteromonas halophila TaxID=516698 RepID=A0A918N0J7_9ALTE|nr:hypothetical protein [Alteromonas halophila]GGW89783.1 hypothetical protein GCM10007391_25120 [Alteromonas halophila]
MIFEFIPVSAFTLMVVLVVYSLFAQKVTVFSVVLFVQFFMEMLHQGIELYVGEIDGTLPAHLINFFWYMSFAVTDILIIFVLFRLIRLFKLRADWLVKAVAGSYAMYALIQLSRYIDRMLLETNILGAFYRAAIINLNNIVVLMLVCYLILELVGFVRKKHSDTQIY